MLPSDTQKLREKNFLADIQEVNKGRGQSRVQGYGPLQIAKFWAVYIQMGYKKFLSCCYFDQCCMLSPFSVLGKCFTIRMVDRFLGNYQLFAKSLFNEQYRLMLSAICRLPVRPDLLPACFFLRVVSALCVRDVVTVLLLAVCSSSLRGTQDGSKRNTQIYRYSVIEI